MRYVNTTNNVIMVPHAGLLKAVAPGDKIELLVAGIPGLTEVKPVVVNKPKPKPKKHVAKKSKFRG